MSDTLSTVANVLATIGFAAGLGHISFNFLSSIHHAPQEIQQLAAQLETFSATFTGIEMIGPSLPNPNAISTEFLDRLRSCMADIEEVGQRVRRLKRHLEQNRTRKFSTMLQWQHQKSALIQSTQRVQSHYMVFLMAFMALQAQLGLKHQALIETVLRTVAQTNTQRSVPVSPNWLSETKAIPTNHSSLSHGNFLNHVKRADTDRVRCGEKLSLTNMRLKSNVGDSVLRPITSWGLAYEPHVQHLSIRAATFKHWKRYFIQFKFWRGSLFVRYWHKDQEPAIGPLPQNQGGGIGISFVIPFLPARHATVTASYIRTLKKKPWMSLVLHWNMSLCCVVPKNSEIMEFASLGNLEAIMRLFQSGKAAPTDVTPEGNSVLHMAVRHNHLEVCRLLLREGANVNAAGIEGDTPLHVAVSKTRTYDVARLLIENGADLGNCNEGSETVLHTYYNDTVQRIIVNHGEMIEYNVKDGRGMTPLHFMTWSSKCTVATVKQLVEHDFLACTLLKDDEGRSVLHFAAQRGNTAVFEYLLGLGRHMDIRCRDRRGRTVLHYAVESHRIEILNKIVEHGLSIRAQDTKGRTVLHHAAWRGNLEAVKRVVELGAAEDLLSRDHHGKTPIDVAIEEGAAAVVSYLGDVAAKLGISISRQVGIQLDASQAREPIPSLQFTSAQQSRYTSPQICLCGKQSSHKLRPISSLDLLQERQHDCPVHNPRSGYLGRGFAIPGSLETLISFATETLKDLRWTSAIVILVLCFLFPVGWFEKGLGLL